MKTNRTRGRSGLIVIATATLVIAAVIAVAQADSLVTVGSPSTTFSQNKQSEPSVAIDPADPSVVAAGAFDGIDLAPCNASGCPSLVTHGVGGSGDYFSFDGGGSWTHPTYEGWSARTGTYGVGPIGTVPHYYENDLQSFADSVVAFGPKPSGGSFSYANGARLYYSNLAVNFPAAKKKDQAFKGTEPLVAAIAVSHTDDPSSAAANDASAWSDPAIVDFTRRSSTTAADKPWLAADDAASSTYFGNVYVCYTNFVGQENTSSLPNAVFFSRSTDGGDTWSTPQRLTQSSPTHTDGEGREACQVATDSNGVVYLLWEDLLKRHDVFKLAKSFDGGVTFTKPSAIAQVSDVGAPDGVGQISFDGVAGARTNSFASLVVANGAPTGDGAPNTIALAWSDGSDGLGNEHALVQLSNDGGATWTPVQAIEESGDRPDMPAIAISPNGQDLYLVYDAFLQGFQETTSTPRLFQGVVRHADLSGTAISNLATLDRGAVGDARASSSTHHPIFGFLGDYDSVAATNAGAVAVYNDARNAAVCDAVDVYRQSLVDGSPIPEPDLATDCPPTFGNTDIYSVAATDPTP